jgi:branched-subunit amino acid aminotransferase/4-amino-4-deoxychorismate lyase
MNAPQVVLDGVARPAAEARVSPFDRGFLYGDGVFETMRAESGRVLRLDRHLLRLRAGMAALRIDACPAAEPAALAAAASLLLDANGLGGRTAAVKVVVTRGEARGLGFPQSPHPTVLVTAEPWEAPARACAPGWRLHAVTALAPAPIARQKALAYLRMLAARQEALDAGADEALVLDARGKVVETAAGCLLVLTRRGWVRPVHPLQLPGITVAAAAEILRARGLPVAEREMGARELGRCRAAWITSALSLVVPVASVAGRALPSTEAGLAAEVRAALLSPAG